nr:cytochrome P450 94A1-like [Tanacetum cinerariifolium]
MIKTNFENYPKGTRFISILEDFLGRGIFNAEGESWRAQRKIASYEFNTRSLRNFVMETASVELHDRFIPVLEKAADMNQVVDLQDLLERYTFDNICKVAFNTDPACLTDEGTSGTEFMRAFEEAATLSTQRFITVFPTLYKVKKLLKFGSESRLQKSIATVHKFADNIIKSRMEERVEKPDEDLLSRFMGKSEYSPEFLRDIVISFILAGRDTTSSALTWFFWILSSHHEVEHKILDELRTIRLRSGKSCYSLDELRQMHYLHAAISEGLRKEMAFTQLKLVAATITEMFRMEVLDPAEMNNPPEHVLAFTIRMKNGLKIKRLNKQEHKQSLGRGEHLPTRDLYSRLSKLLFPKTSSSFSLEREGESVMLENMIDVTDCGTSMVPEFDGYNFPCLVKIYDTREAQ